jgi:hypothetical protein
MVKEGRRKEEVPPPEKLKEDGCIVEGSAFLLLIAVFCASGHLPPYSWREEKIYFAELWRL